MTLPLCGCLFFLTHGPAVCAWAASPPPASSTAPLSSAEQTPSFQLLRALVTWASSAAPESWPLIPTSSASPSGSGATPQYSSILCTTAAWGGWEGSLVPQGPGASLLSPPTLSAHICVFLHVCFPMLVTHSSTPCVCLSFSVPHMPGGNPGSPAPGLPVVFLPLLHFHRSPLQLPLSSGPFLPVSRCPGLWQEGRLSTSLTSGSLPSTAWSQGWLQGRWPRVD